MKIVIKTLQGKQLPLEVEETDTVITYHSSYQVIDSSSKRESSGRTLNASRLNEAHCLW
jgi:hypothetical protein